MYMASLKVPLTEEEVKKTSVANIRIEYNKMAKDYNRIVENELLLCPKCNTWQKADTGFYFDKEYATNRYPLCKRCILFEVEQRKSEREEPNETKDSVKKVLQKMDRIFDENFYDECVKGALDGVKEKNRQSPFATYITAIQSLPNWKDTRTGKPKGWSESIFRDGSEQSEEEINENSRIIKAARKRFGNDYPLSDLLFLETQYEDWTQRYACESKAQELLFQRIAHTQLAIEKAQRQGKDTDKLDKTLQDLMTSNAIKPASNNSSSFSDSKTFGQLIELWEQNKPIPQVEEEFQDVDNIALYTDVFYRGHLAKMMGLKNGYSSLYDSYMDKYRAKKKTYQEEENSEALFDQIFGGQINEE